MTVYLFTTDRQRYFSCKEIHTFAKEYMLDWFPKLPSYQAFNNRINNLWSAFKVLAERIIGDFLPADCDPDISLTDSFPIMTCKGRNRTGKVATELTSKGYCSTKEMYYHGMKLHALNYRRPHRIPFPESLIVTSAEVNDLTAFKQAFGESLFNRTVYGDKSFSDREYFAEKEVSNNFTMLTPVKLVKGEPENIRQRERACNDIFSCAVSTVRQPIESFFNWLNEKTSIQRASKVRSTKGLLLHLFGKIAAAFIYLIF
jgi:hypothetical protein